MKNFLTFLINDIGNQPEIYDNDFGINLQNSGMNGFSLIWENICEIKNNLQIYCFSLFVFHLTINII